jgi:hypothetical protein
VKVDGDRGSSAVIMSNSLTYAGGQRMEVKEDDEEIPAAAAAYAYLVLE